jgi:hypothetical protein
VEVEPEKPGEQLHNLEVREAVVHTVPQLSQVHRQRNQLRLGEDMVILEEMGILHPVII